MRFMIIVKGNADSEAGAMPSTEVLSAMTQFNEELVKAGVMIAGEGLHPSSRGARVNFHTDGSTSVVDGPFAESKELIAGYWIIQVSSIDEAVEWVRRVPNPERAESQIEIRQVFEVDDFGDELTPELREKDAQLREATGQQGA